MRIGAGLSTQASSREAAIEAAMSARQALLGARADVAFVFASPEHLERADHILAGVHEAASPAGLIGCVGEAVIGGSREVEGGPAVSVLLCQLPGGVETFHMTLHPTESGGVFAGWRFGAGLPDDAAAVHVMICDPFSFPVDSLLAQLNEAVPKVSVVGGMASGAQQPGETVLFQDRTIHHEGAVGVRLAGALDVRTLVSQGCRPVGNSFVVTRAEENVVFELAGRPPLERLRETVAALSPPDRELVAQGLHVGRVIDEYKTEFGQGDFLIRSVLGADPESGAIAVGDRMEVGETVQFHVRDAASADEELRALLEREVRSFPHSAAGALLFTCNGRGSRMFSTPDHDASLVSSLLGEVPLAGFFCAGELGPVGGRNFLHGFTASLAVFLDPGATDGRSDGADT
jgi:small ligand-binding sensory domain FIST